MLGRSHVLAALAALCGSRVNFSVQGPSAVAAHVQANRLRLPGHWGARFLALFPHRSSLTKLGYDVVYYSCTGLFAAANTPAPIVVTLRKAVAASFADANFKGATAKVSTPIQYLDQDEFKGFFAADAKRLPEVVRQIGRVEEKK